MLLVDAVEVFSLIPSSWPCKQDITYCCVAPLHRNRHCRFICQRSDPAKSELAARTTVVSVVEPSALPMNGRSKAPASAGADTDL
jgi:hypothetical protein